MRTVKVALYGHFGSGNIGNDSTLQAALENMRELLPSARFTCVCNGPEDVHERFGVEAVPINYFDVRSKQHAVRSKWAKLKRKIAWPIREARLWVDRIRWFRGVDLFVIVGTGAVDDMAVATPWDAPFALYKWCKCAKSGGARVAFLSVGVGPIVHPVSRFLMLRALRVADFRSYRETSAVQYLAAARFDTHVDAITPDLVFSLRATPSVPFGNASNQKTIGLGLINYFGWRNDTDAGEQVFHRYLSHMKRFATHLVEQGYRIRILHGDVTDQRAVEDVMSHLCVTFPSGRGDLFVAEPIGNVDDLIRQLAQVQVVVASRFHNVLCSLMAERPVVSIGYHEKNRLLMSDVGLRDYCQDIDTLDYGHLVDQFTTCWERRVLLSQQVHSKLDGYRARLDAQYRELLAPFAGAP